MLGSEQHYGLDHFFGPIEVALKPSNSLEAPPNKALRLKMGSTIGNGKRDTALSASQCSLSSTFIRFSPSKLRPDAVLRASSTHCLAEALWTSLAQASRGFLNRRLPLHRSAYFQLSPMSRTASSLTTELDVPAYVDARAICRIERPA